MLKKPEHRFVTRDAFKEHSGEAYLHKGNNERQCDAKEAGNWYGISSVLLEGGYGKERKPQNLHHTATVGYYMLLFDDKRKCRFILSSPQFLPHTVEWTPTYH